jgi:hypothetical protein
MSAPVPAAATAPLLASGAAGVAAGVAAAVSIFVTAAMPVGLAWVQRQLGAQEKTPVELSASGGYGPINSYGSSFRS